MSVPPSCGQTTDFRQNNPKRCAHQLSGNRTERPRLGPPPKILGPLRLYLLHHVDQFVKWGARVFFSSRTLPQQGPSSASM